MTTIRAKEGGRMFGQRKKRGSAVAARRRLASLFVVAFSLLLIALFLLLVPRAWLADPMAVRP